MIKLLEEVHGQLNQKIWDGDELKPEVHDKLLDIANAFIEFIEYPVSVADIRIVGSQASFNYSDTSDLDLHLIVNFSTLDVPDEMLRMFFDGKKQLFKDTYDVTIKGIDVELYVEDMRTSARSNGIYSVTQDMWIKYPEPLDDIEIPDMDESIKRISDYVDGLIASGSFNEVQHFIDKIYMMRKDALSLYGEMSSGNLLFKELRNRGIIDRLYDRLNALKSDELSLESMQ